jgi:hypothetical protein
LIFPNNNNKFHCDKGTENYRCVVIDTRNLLPAQSLATSGNGGLDESSTIFSIEEMVVVEKEDDSRALYNRV